MRKLIVILVIVLPLMLLSIDIRDYNFPDSFYQEAYLRGNFNLRDGNQDQTSYSGSFGGSYDIKYSSLPFTWWLGVDASLDLNRGPNSFDSSAEGYRIFLNSVADRYLGDTNAFTYGSLDLGYRKQMIMDDADDPYVKLGIGVGYGRVIDATVLAKAIRIVDELIKYNVLVRTISDSAYLELAQIIDKEAEYRAEHGALEYKKYWFEDMEEVFFVEGVLSDGSLRALGLVRLQEVLEQRYSRRMHGWTIRAGVGYILSNYDGSDSDPTLDVGFMFAHPFSYKLQLIERFDYSTILEDEISHSIKNTLSVTYELSSQVDWENRLITSIFIPSDDTLENVIENTLESSFFYYLTNQVNLITTLRFRLYDDGIDNNGNDDLETTFFLGVTYRLR